ncbi:MAG TPA: LysR family transcriptional regulator [Gammaproteobacteria bacterium]|nr:LysR family transcriptional regulator [Gammaproteobacteria bacterium]
MDKLKLMRTFMLAVEEGSLAQAARALGISKAAASKQLIELESELNTQLINRTTRMLKLTEIGESYYESVKAVFSAVREAESVVTQSLDKPSGTLRIASHRYFGERFIINHIKEFLSLYPDLKIDIELADRFPDIEREDFDVLCGVSHEGPEHLVRKRIKTIRHVLCASPEYIAEFGMPESPDDLKQFHYITHSFRKPDTILSFKNDKEIFLDYVIRLNDAQAMLQCALQGLGFIKIFNYFVDEHIRQGRLIEILKEYSEPPKSLYIFYKQQKFLPNKIRVFIDFLTKKLDS